MGSLTLSQSLYLCLGQGSYMPTQVIHRNLKKDAHWQMLLSALCAVDSYMVTFSQIFILRNQGLTLKC